MDWREEYERRLASAQEAVEVVRGGDLMVIAIAGPRVLPHALARFSREGS